MMKGDFTVEKKTETGKYCPFMKIVCCREKCEGYDVKRRECSLLVEKRNRYQGIKKQNVFLKVVSLFLVCSLVTIGTFVFFKMREFENSQSCNSDSIENAQDGGMDDNDNAQLSPDENEYVATDEYAVALVDDYFENSRMTRYSAATVSAITVYANEKGVLEFGTVEIESPWTTASSTEKQTHLVEKGKNVISLKTPLSVALDETLFLGGGETNVQLKAFKEEKRSIGKTALLTDGKLSSAFTETKYALDIEVEMSFLDNSKKDVFPSVETQFGDFTEKSTVVLSSAPFVYRSLTLFECSTITKIGVPVLTLADSEKENVFTVHVVEYTEPFTKLKTVSTHRLFIPANTYASETVNCWHYFSVNIPVAENQTLAFSDTADTVYWGFSTSSLYEQYRYYYTSSGGVQPSSALTNGIYFDIEIEKNQTFSLETLAEQKQFVNEWLLLQTKKLSVMGDSISTYKGYSNDSTNTNSSIGKNAVFYTGTNIINSVSDTWWKEVGLDVLVNNSWSGSRVSTTNGTAGAGCMTRTYNLHDNTGSNIGEMPDIIAVYLGINDYNKKTPLGAFKELSEIYDEKSGSYIGKTEEFASAYAIMIHKIKNTYPNSEIFCFTLNPSTRRTDRELLEEFNDTIRYVAEYFDCGIVDLYKASGFTWENCKIFTGDGIHPNDTGMEMIASCFQRALIAHQIEKKEK
jgi:lysophospholipase L1-like esterase